MGSNGKGTKVTTAPANQSIAECAFIYLLRHVWKVDTAGNAYRCRDKRTTPATDRRAGEDSARGGKERGLVRLGRNGGRSEVGTKPDGKMRSVILCGSAELINI